MKKSIWVLIAGVLIGAVVMFFAFKPLAPLFSGSAVKNSYYPVMAKLDQGGEYLAYWHAAPLLQKIDGFMEKMKPAVGGNPEAQKVVAVLQKLLLDTGIKEISGIGFSTIARKPDLYRSTLVLHHYASDNKGIIWNLADPAPHPLASLPLLPANTALAAAGDFLPQRLWDWLIKEAEFLNLADVKAGLLKAGPSLQGQGIDLGRLLGGFAGHFGGIMTLDDKKPFTTQVAGKPMAIPQPGMAVFVSVKDSYLFDLLASKVPGAQKSEEKGVKKLQFAVKQPPFLDEPLFLQAQGWLIFASNSGLAAEMLNLDGKSPRLRDSADYKKIADGLPSQAGSFRYLGPALFRLARELLTRFTFETGHSRQEETNIKVFFGMLPDEIALCGVGQTLPDGMVFTFNHNFDLTPLMMLPAAGIVSAIAIPNFLVAAQKGKQKSTMADMRSISVALESYVVDNGRLPPGETLADLLPALQPAYIRQLPQKDAWGNEFLFKRAGADSYLIASAGRDGQFLGWEQEGSYAVASIVDFNRDIVIKSGAFVFAPAQK